MTLPWPVKCSDWSFKGNELCGKFANFIVDGSMVCGDHAKTIRQTQAMVLSKNRVTDNLIWFGMTEGEVNPE